MAGEFERHTLSCSQPSREKVRVANTRRIGDSQKGIAPGHTVGVLATGRAATEPGEDDSFHASSWNTPKCAERFYHPTNECPGAGVPKNPSKGIPDRAEDVGVMVGVHVPRRSADEVNEPSVLGSQLGFDVRPPDLPEYQSLEQFAQTVEPPVWPDERRNLRPWQNWRVEGQAGVPPEFKWSAGHAPRPNRLGRVG